MDLPLFNLRTILLAILIVNPGGQESTLANSFYPACTHLTPIWRNVVSIQNLIDEYLHGAQLLRSTLDGMTPEQINTSPIAGKWSTRQVVCHLADFEPVYADRMKRVIAEEQPTYFGGDPDVFAAKLAYDQRDIEEEIQLIEVTRKHVARILQTLSPEDFQRTGNHSEDGPLTLEVLLQRITGHIPHHVAFIEEKKAALSC